MSDFVLASGVWLVLCVFAGELLHGGDRAAALIGGLSALCAWVWRAQ